MPAPGGRLKVYLGFAAGVGKTTRLLQEARALKGRAIDVAVGLAETHGRADTRALLDGLELLPRRQVVYREVVVEEMDVDALLARRPRTVIVDDLVHTNPPGSRHPRRYQDVLALLDAGIDVIGAFDVQHLESLNDVVQRVTRVAVRDTVPDSFLRRADEVVALDLAVDDLLQRLEAGQIVPPDRLPWAREHWFTPRNLASLRELALREVAESLDRAARGQRAAADPKAEATGRVMVCLSSRPTRASALLRRGSRLAGRLNNAWFVVHVQTPREAPHRIGAETQRHLLANAEHARELGAEVVHLQAADPVAALLDFARSHGVGQIIVGQSREPWWRRALGRSPATRLVDQAAGFDVLVASLEDDR